MATEHGVKVQTESSRYTVSPSRDQNQTQEVLNAFNDECQRNPNAKKVDVQVSEHSPIDPKFRW